ncbi:hypothetical protein TWF102_008160 [Orbilia oligospora]|uniref:Zn(2)-C6 fungal-type domain-containing protein n=1 Tax=Orbilia oligospora TaxID=2813651 RepID=A0A7C8JGA8_ORBOL|nr:hypothetical protein TWF706_001826 [Orbilia oligospora]KAF3110587.1 hypothetical protein TWF102_008160 [Orbilia oligospora]KAF3114812.1 hypothetical protein TWF103_000541 [Orbilia oligospora]KAF3149040.1 hypothetical protein TWF594_000488 [Orbilia oligospora]
MTDISEFTSVFRARINLNDRRKANKRNRQALSCLACRSRKLKCDRQNPCTACSKRGEGSACTFIATTGSNGAGSAGIIKPSSGSAVADTKRSEAQAKLQKLEEIVQQLIQSGAVVSKPGDNRNNSAKRTSREAVQPRTQPDSNEDDGPQDEPTSDNKRHQQAPVFMCYNQASGGYVGATHWAALLEQINCVKECLEDGMDRDSSNQSVSDDSPVTDDADLILGNGSGNLTIEDAIRSLPPRHVADRLLQIYYSVKFSNALFIHTTKFRREYEAFWKNPSSATLVWISILFSILCMGSIIAARGNKLIALEAYDIEAAKLCSKARQCLVAGHHTKCQPYVIEALVIYSYCKYQLNVDSDSTLWALAGYVTRLAQRLGYHRDPKHLGKFTPFEAEMRRRTWFWVSTFDLIFSFQYGMPGIIHDEQCDTESPGNYGDEDFDEDTVIMPPPRPATEFTNMLYYCHKIKMTSVFRRVIGQALALRQPDYDQILKLDKELDEVHNGIPAVLRLNESIRESSFADASYMILHRMVLELTYHKCLCVLHRMYLTFEKDNPKYEYSRNRARESALRILGLQSDAYDESQPGGRLWEERWMVSSLTIHDFLLASMIMCLDLSEKKDTDASKNSRCLIALQKSYRIWSEKKHMSRDALHASNVLAAMLARATGPTAEQPDTAKTAMPLPPTSNLPPTSPFTGTVIESNSLSQERNPIFSVSTLGLGSDNSTAFGSMPMDTSAHISTISNNMVGMSGGTEQDRSEQVGEFVPRQLTAREETFGLGFGNDVYPMVDTFEPLDFDTLMSGSGNIDWGLVDRYLFDKTVNFGDNSPILDNMQIITPDESDTSSGQPGPASQSSASSSNPERQRL